MTVTQYIKEVKEKLQQVSTAEITMVELSFRTREQGLTTAEITVFYTTGEKSWNFSEAVYEIEITQDFPEVIYAACVKQLLKRGFYKGDLIKAKQLEL